MYAFEFVKLSLKHPVQMTNSHLLIYFNIFVGTFTLSVPAPLSTSLITSVNENYNAQLEIIMICLVAVGGKQALLYIA
jgi:hypothetical protein